MDDDEAKRRPGWIYFGGLFLAIALSRHLGSSMPPLDDSTRVLVVSVVTALISGVLAYSIYRFARM